MKSKRIVTPNGAEEHSPFAFYEVTIKISHIDRIRKFIDYCAMDTTMLIFAAGLLAGFMNSVAGGGSFITFPTLIFAGVPSVSANATSTVALFPGSIAGAWAYRRECTTFTAAPLKAMIFASLTGGLLGALLLQLTPKMLFDKAIPWLLAVGTAVFAAGPKLGGLMQRKLHGQSAALLTAQTLLGIYGGYFGGAVGIMMMAVWSLFGILDIRVMNGIKTLLVGVTNAAAVLWFSAMGMVWWPQALVMLAGAIIGGYSGARCARHLNPIFLRRGITVFNIIITTYFFVKMMS